MEQVKRRLNERANAMQKRCLYIFLDEGGNLDFSATGTRFFLLSSVTKERPFQAYRDLTELKYDLVEAGTAIEYFHASEDRQPIRDAVFRVIQENLSGIRVDSLIVDKRKTVPALRSDTRFYPEMLGHLLRFIVSHHDMTQIAAVIVFTDRLPVRSKREAVEKAIKMTLSKMLPGVQYSIFHHASKSNFDLQIADYCNWAVYRKWDSGDTRSYDLIRAVVKSEFDIFRPGMRFYY